MKKHAFSIINIIFFLVVLYFSYININQFSYVSFSKNSDALQISTSILIFICYFIGLIFGIIQSIASKNIYKNQIEFYARKNEKLSQQNEIDSDDKEALERKIAALEIALKNALKK